MGDAGRSTISSNNVTLRLGDVNKLQISVARAEYLSAFAMLGEAVGGVPRGLRSEWSAQVDRTINGAGRSAAQSLGAPSGSFVPSFIVPLYSTLDASLVRTLTHIRNADPDDLTRGLFEDFGDEIPATWRQAADHPEAWLSSFSSAITSAAQVTSTLWKHAGPLLDREVERVGVALVRQVGESLLSNLGSRITLDNGSLTFRHSWPGEHDLAGRKIVLVPMISGDKMLITQFDNNESVWIGYPLRGLGNLFSSPPRSSRTDALAVLLGPVRAEILCHLEQPTAMGALAADLAMPPSQLSFHCEHLEGAELLTRHRQGRSVRVARTERGTRLLALYTD